MCCRGHQLGFCNTGLPLPRFRRGNCQCYAAAVQLKRHSHTCPRAFQSTFTFSERTDELISLILVKMKENDLPVSGNVFGNEIELWPLSSLLWQAFPENVAEDSSQFQVKLCIFILKKCPCLMKQVLFKGVLQGAELVKCSSFFLLPIRMTQ